MALSMMLEMQCLLGIQCKEFTMISADQMNLKSIIVVTDDVDKLFEISEQQVLGAIGEIGDMTQFSQLISKNLSLYHIKNKYPLDTPAAAHFISKNMADNNVIRNASPFVLNLLIGGYDETSGGQLYSVDFLGSRHRMSYVAHGWGGLLSCSLLDRYYRPNLTEQEAYELLKMCITEVQKRLFTNLPNFKVKTISKNGIRTLPTINTAMLTGK